MTYIYECRECGNEMRIDDIDENGKYTDVYFICDSCDNGCVVEYVRGKPNKVDWSYD